ncbi:hypothetical protein [Hugenholtzia roseola]|uniref:hypothetical protein n=1 Tax=Hugenholtzia roseola TaxID=1002 RepID=UPI0003FFEDE1|nr:hypothetical protein [Hugenholtzia roseola]
MNKQQLFSLVAIIFSVFSLPKIEEQKSFRLDLSPHLAEQIACQWDFSAADTSFIQTQSKKNVLDFDSLFNNAYLSNNSVQVKEAHAEALMRLFENPDSAYFTAEWNEKSKIAAGAYLSLEYRQYCKRHSLFLEAQNAVFNGFFVEDSLLKVSVSFSLKYQKNMGADTDSLYSVQVSKKEAVFKVVKKNKKIVLFLERVVKLNKGNLRYERKLFFPKIRHLEIKSLFESKPQTYKRNDTLQFIWRDNLCQKPVAVEIWRRSDSDTSGRYDSFSALLYNGLDTNRVAIVLSERVSNGSYYFLIRGLENPNLIAKSKVFYVENDTVVNPCTYQDILYAAIKPLDATKSKIQSGDLLRLSWQSKYVSNVKVFLYQGKKQVLKIGDYNRTNVGGIDWQVPKSLAKGTYFVRVQSLECPKISVDSTPFQISKFKQNKDE